MPQEIAQRGSGIYNLGILETQQDMAGPGQPALCDTACTDDFESSLPTSAIL